MDSRGNVILVFGMRSTGKSKESKDIAEIFRMFNKKTIILDHTQNDDTYGDIQKLNVTDLAYRLPKKSVFRVQCKWQEFLANTQNITNACILIDDATALFRGRSPEALLEWCGKAKNQRLEIIFQMHTITEVAPDLLRAANIWFLKQTNDSFPIKKSCKNANIIEKILLEIQAENRNYDEEQRWATRLVDFDREEVYVKDLDSNDYYEFKKFDYYL